MPRLIVPSRGGGRKLMRTLRVGAELALGDGDAVGDSCAAVSVAKANTATICNLKSAICILFRCNSASSRSGKDYRAIRNRAGNSHRHRWPRIVDVIDRSA